MASYSHLVKVVLIGASGAGKTALTQGFSQGRFLDPVPSYCSTSGVDFATKTVMVGDKTVRVQIWDTAGQEAFRSITTAFYRGAHGILVVYDASIKPSEIEYDMNRHMSHVIDHGDPGVVTGVLRNKVDLLDAKERDDKLKQCASFEQEHEFDFARNTSAKTHEGVEDAFLELITRVVAAMDAKGGDGEGVQYVDVATKSSGHTQKCC